MKTKSDRNGASTRHSLRRLVLGQTVVNRSSGRRMELLAIEDYGEGPLLRLRPAKGDSERQRFMREQTAVCWPREWVWAPGDQTEFHFENNEARNGERQKPSTEETNER